MNYKEKVVKVGVLPRSIHRFDHIFFIRYRNEAIQKDPERRLEGLQIL